MSIKNLKSLFSRKFVNKRSKYLTTKEFNDLNSVIQHV